MPRRHRGLLALVIAFALLLGGRLLAESATNRLWAGALGAGEPLGAIASARALLLALAVGGGAVWCLGNLWFLTRSIGSVQVPRRLGDLEILEQVPRRYLVLGAAVIGLVIAGLIGWTARDWWITRALWTAWTPIGEQEPVLGRDVGWYLFRLPWMRDLQRFALWHVGVVLGVVLALYALIGAMRVRERSVAVSEMARAHVGGLLVTFAIALFWGYRLEPAEHVAGLTGVPADTVLTAVRIPAARILSALALIAGLAATVWMWAGRAALVVVPWLALGAASFAAHFVAPTIAAVGARPAPAVNADARARLTRLAYGLPAETTLTVAAPVRAAVDGTPVWDAFAVGFTLDRTMPGRPWDRFVDPHLTNENGRPVWLAVREMDLEEARQSETRMTWDQVHGATYGRSEGVVAVDAVAVTERGLPRYYTRLDAAPGDTPTALPIASNGFWFSPAMTDYIVVPADGELRGIPLGGFWRRLALAWALQSPQLLSGDRSAETLVLLDRAVSRRLARYAPFARFGAAYPALVRGRLVWLAAGYVWADGFPAVERASWRGRSVGYLRMGFVGMVDAVSGATELYLAPGADPVSRAWAELTSPLVRPTVTMPQDVRAALRYPEELFRVQLRLAVDAFGGIVRSTEPHATVGRALVDSTTRLRLRSAIEDERLRVLVDGAMTDNGPRLERVRLADTTAMFGSLPLAQSMARGAAPMAAIPGPLKLAVGPLGVAGVQTYYAEPGAPGAPPWVAEVAVGWRGAAGHGPTLAEAVARVIPVATDRPAGVELLPALREWFERLDSARLAGDWEAFGRAWERLRGLLADSAPTN